MAKHVNLNEKAETLKTQTSDVRIEWERPALRRVQANEAEASSGIGPQQGNQKS